MSTLTIAVAHHRAGPHASHDNDIYRAICNVDPAGRRPEGFAEYDELGGLPHANQIYCELSALHYACSRYNTARIGLAHYRRLFITKPHGLKHRLSAKVFDVPRWDWADLHRFGADGSDLLEVIGDKDWTTPHRIDVRRWGYRSVWDQFAHWHPTSFLEAVGQAVHAVLPHMPSVEEYLKGSYNLYPFNMFLARKCFVRSYCEFLWPVLEDTCARIGPVDDPYQLRYAGFLAERLHGYWLTVLAPSDMSIGALPVGILTGQVMNSRTGGAEDLTSSSGSKTSYRLTRDYILKQCLPPSLRLTLGSTKRTFRSMLKRNHSVGPRSPFD
jgi:hypothetical protein